MGFGMKRTLLIGLAIVVLILIVLFVYPGRGSQPDYPLLYHYQSESDPYANPGCGIPMLPLHPTNLAKP